MNKNIIKSLLLTMIISVSGFAATLTEKQKSDLVFMYQEEKMARDVYINFYKTYPSSSVFSNISISEQSHMIAVKNLCIKYNIDIKNIDDTKIGVFVLPELQNLYNNLIATGSLSLKNGLNVGVDIEKKDMTDILEKEQGMPKDIVRVFENLRNGSKNHLDAFLSNLTKLN